MKKQKAPKQTPESIKLAIAMFEGRQITDQEAKRIFLTTRRRNKLLKRTFGLSEEEVDCICLYKDEIRAILKEFCYTKEQRVKENLRELEARAIAKMRDPDRRRARQMRALLSAR